VEARRWPIIGYHDGSTRVVASEFGLGLQGEHAVTVIAAVIADDGSIFIAADSDSNGEETYYQFAEPKVRLYEFQDRSILGWGGAGDSAQTHTAFDYAWDKLSKTLPAGARDHLVREWMQDFACQWTAECNAMEPTAKTEDGELQSNGLIGYRGKLYRLQQHECRELKMSYAAVGAGVHYAMGSLYSTDMYCRDLPSDRARVAVEAAIKFDKYCSGSVDMIRVPSGLA
jgi:ATP-dependent protease HslVU (ClpYQ) peptidase subunit